MGTRLQKQGPIVPLVPHLLPLIGAGWGSGRGGEGGGG